MIYTVNGDKNIKNKTFVIFMYIFLKLFIYIIKTTWKLYEFNMYQILFLNGQKSLEIKCNIYNITFS